MHNPLMDSKLSYDIDENLDIFYNRDAEDTYIGAISKHECVVETNFVIELLEEVKQLQEVKKKYESFLYFEGFNPKEVLES